MNARVYLCLATALAAASSASASFDLSVTSIPKEQILSGGPDKDGIPALTGPRFLDVANAAFLRDRDVVVGFVNGAEARAYPIRILNWHEVVNDTVAGQAVAVTYCPLTGSAVAFDRTVGDHVLTFGVSGRLYLSNVLMYDHQSESLWSQLAQAAVTGSMTHTALRALPSDVTSWRDWRTRYPHTLVLSIDTGHARDYSRDPYASYRTSSDIMFPVNHNDTRLSSKDVIVGIRVGQTSKAYPVARLPNGDLVDEFAGQRFRVNWDRAAQRATISEADSGRVVPSVVAFWFAWAAFNPGTEIWGGPPAPAASRSQIPGDVVATETVSIDDHSAHWTDLLGVAVALMGTADDDQPPMLVIRGNLKNSSAAPLEHVRLAFELLDADGHVVATETGYNRRAEALQPVDAPDPWPAEEVPAIEPITGGSVDSFRMIFLGRDIPHFASYRVRVLDVATERRRASAGTNSGHQDGAATGPLD